MAKRNSNFACILVAWNKTILKTTTAIWRELWMKHTYVIVIIILTEEMVYARVWAVHSLSSRTFWGMRLLTWNNLNSFLQYSESITKSLTIVKFILEIYVAENLWVFFIATKELWKFRVFINSSCIHIDIKMMIFPSVSWMQSVCLNKCLMSIFLCLDLQMCQINNK